MLSFSLHDTSIPFNNLWEKPSSSSNKWFNLSKSIVAACFKPDEREPIERKLEEETDQEPLKPEGENDASTVYVYESPKIVFNYESPKN